MPEPPDPVLAHQNITPTTHNNAQPPASPAAAPEGVPPSSAGRQQVAGAMFRDPTRGYQPQLGMPNQHAATVVVRSAPTFPCFVFVCSSPAADGCQLLPGSAVLFDRMDGLTDTLGLQAKTGFLVKSSSGKKNEQGREIPQKHEKFQNRFFAIVDGPQVQHTPLCFQGTAAPHTQCCPAVWVVRAQR